MLIQNKIFLRQKRGIGDLFNTVFSLVRQNFKVIAGALLMVAGPFILLTSVVSALLQATVMEEIKEFTELVFREGSTQYLSDLFTRNWMWFLVVWFFGLLAFSFIRATTSNFFVLYDSKTEGEELTSAEIARKSFRDGFRIFGGVLMLSVISLIPLALIIGLIAFPISYGGIVATIIIGFFLLLLLFAFGPQLTYIFQFSIWFSMIRDEESLFGAVKNTFKNIKGKFWQTWVLMTGIFFIVSILNYITAIPVGIYSQISVFTRTNELNSGSVSLLYVVLFVFSQFGSNFFQCLGDLMVIVSYYSFEEEKTGAGLQSRIEEIGKDNPSE
ncbi:MAG: hypothetical protein ACK5D5_06460 [Bacteroidota bacterium]|jgi:hypothetical protein